MASSNTDLLLFEPSFDGHYLHYVARIARAALSKGLSVTLTTSAEGVHAAKRILDDLDVTLRTDRPNVSGSLIDIQFKSIAWFNEELALVKPKHAMLPFGNHISKVLGFKKIESGASSISLLLMRDHFHLEAMGAEGPSSKRRLLDEWLFKLMLTNKAVKNIFTIDPLLVEYANQKHFRKSEKLAYIPDPIADLQMVDRDNAKSELAIPSDHRVILVYGVLDERKGLAPLIEAVGLSNNKKIHILAVGKQNETAKVALASDSALQLTSEGRITVFEGFASKELEGLAFSAAEIVWIGYKGHFGSSGVLYQASQASVPIVATGQGLIGYEARHNDVGVILKSYEPTDINEAIDAVLSASAQAQVSWKANMERFALEHSESNFATSILGKLFN